MKSFRLFSRILVLAFFPETSHQFGKNIEFNVSYCIVQDSLRNVNFTEKEDTVGLVRDCHSSRSISLKKLKNVEPRRHN